MESGRKMFRTQTRRTTRPLCETGKTLSRIDRFHAPGHSRTRAACECGLLSGRSGMDLVSGASGIDLRAIWHLAVRRRWVILATAVTLFSAVALHTLRQPKVYSASTSIVIDATPPRFLDSQVADVSDPGSGGYWYARASTETQTSIITSR